MYSSALLRLLHQFRLPSGGKPLQILPACDEAVSAYVQDDGLALQTGLSRFNREVGR